LFGTQSTECPCLELYFLVNLKKYFHTADLPHLLEAFAFISFSQMHLPTRITSWENGGNDGGNNVELLSSLK
jgi:hypothetical protein